MDLLPEGDDVYQGDIRDLHEYLVDIFFENNGGLLGFLKESYNTFLDRLPSIFEATEFKSKDGVFCLVHSCKFYENGKTIEDDRYTVPGGVYGTSKTTFPYFPGYMRLTNKTYQTSLLMRVAKVEPGIDVEDQITRENTGKLFPIVNFPIMLRSKICNLNRIDESNIHVYNKYPELEGDPGGYFIINGRERCIPWQQRLIFASEKVYNGGEKKGVSISTVFKTDSTSKMIEIKQNKKTKKVIYLLNYSSVKSSDKGDPRGINLYLAFRALDYKLSDKSLIKLFESIIPSEMSQDFLPGILMLLQETIIEGERIIGSGKSKNGVSPIDMYFIENDQEASVLTTDLQSARDIAYTNFIDDLFPVIGENKRRKAQMIAYMTIRLFQHIIYPEIYPEDDKNDDANIQFQSPAIVIEKLIQQVWSRLKKTIQDEINKKQTVNKITPDIVTTTIIEKINELNRTIENSFNGSIWGSSISPAKNVVQDLNRDAFNASIIGQLTRVVIESRIRGGPSKKEGGKKTMESRMIRGAQVGTICIMQTPDTHDIGLTGNLAYLARVSDEIDIGTFEVSLSEALDKGDIYPSRSESDYRMILLNGIIIGWGNIEYLFEKIRNLRRQGKLYASYDEEGEPVPYYDLGLQISNGNLYLRVSSGRALGARIIVYTKTTTIDDVDFVYQYIKNPEGKTWTELLSNGVIEYLDPAEIAEASLHGKYKDLLIANDKVETLYEQYLVASEDERKQIKKKIDEINLEDVKTHISLSPDEIYGHAGATTPYANRILGPRIPLQCKMVEQTMTSHSSTVRHFYAPKIRTLIRGDAPLIYNTHATRLGFDFYHTGSTVRIAFIPFEANQEDSVVWNRDSLDKFFKAQVRYITDEAETRTTDVIKILYKPVSASREKYEGVSEDYYDLRRKLYLTLRKKEADNVELIELIQRRIADDSEKFKIPRPPVSLETLRKFERLYREEEEKYDKENAKDNYDHLDEDGLPKVGWKIKEGQIIVGFLKFSTKGTEGNEILELREQIYQLQDKIGFYKDAIAFVASTEPKVETVTEAKTKGSIIEIPRLKQKTVPDNVRKEEIRKQISKDVTRMPKLFPANDTSDDLVKMNKILDKIKDDYRETLTKIRSIKEDISGSVRAKFSQDGEVEKVTLFSDTDNEKKVKVIIVQNRRPIEGNKEDNRTSQKATIGASKRKEDLPFTRSGQTCDVYVNPLGMPGRMTLAWLLEMLVGKVDAMSGTRTKGDDFKDLDFDRLVKRLEDNNFTASGMEEFYNPFTGQKMKGMIYTGPSHRSALKHIVEDKMGYRANDTTSSRDIVTGQAQKGRGRHGGYRVGMMELDAMGVSGTAKMIQSLMTDSRGAKWQVFCIDCGVPANFIAEPASYHCPRCKGNNFGRAYIPIAFLNLRHILAYAGIVVTLKFDREMDYTINAYAEGFSDDDEDEDDEDNEDDDYDDDGDDYYMDDEDEY